MPPAGNCAPASMQRPNDSNSTPPPRVCGRASIASSSNNSIGEGWRASCHTPKMPPRKSTPDEIRRRFDNDVERFSNLETGQSATVDAPLGLELIAGAASSLNPAATAVLDIGCGAGNYSLKLLQHLPLDSITLIDLSRPMLDRAVQRIAAAHPAVHTTAVQSDIREA